MRKEDKKKDDTKQSVKTVLQNNLFFIKLCMQASPGFIIFACLDAIRNQVSIFFEHTYGIGFVLEAAEFHYPFRQVAKFILILAGMITLGMIFTVFVGDYIMEKERPKVRQKVKLLLYEKARKLDLESYDNPDFYDRLVFSIQESDSQVDRCVTMLQNIVAGVTVFISTGIYFFMKDKVSIIFAVVSFILTYLFNQLFNKLNFKSRIEKNPKDRKRNYVKRVFYLSNYAKELRLHPEVGDIVYEQFQQANQEVYEVEKKYAKKKFFYGFMRFYVCNALFSDVFYISYLTFQAAVRKALSFSSVAILYNSFGRLKEGLRIFTDIYPFACESSLYIQKIRDFLECEINVTSEENLPVSLEAKELELKNVHFAYGTQKDTIEDVSMQIHKGEKIALVGYNGAGKTTLVKLLMRLYDVTEGTITADGKDIRRYNVKEYRNSIGTVFQDFQIFAGNVRENVLMNLAEENKDEDIRESLEKAGLWKRIERYEKGMDTELTTEIMENGVNLSGGEAQKLAIARVFYRKPGLMILDEPSSALDPIAEYQLNHAMLEATKDKTVIFISHRLSTTRLADRIFMLEHGKIVEQGTHESLLSLGGKYAQMWKVQAGAYINVE